MKTLTRVAALVAALVLALAGCSDDSSTSNSSDGHNDADVEFTGEMVPHHEQALRMVAMTRGRDLSPQFEDLTLQIKAAQAPEIWDWLANLNRLGGAPARAFEDMWLRMMIRHHRGAIAMSKDEVENGEFPAAVALAQHIEDSQHAEIEQMRQMLAN